MSSSAELSEPSVKKTSVLEGYLAHYASPLPPRRMSSQQWLDEYSTIHFAIAEARGTGGGPVLERLTRRKDELEDFFHTMFH